MFCTSLRKRLQWASVPALLLSQQQHRWQGSFTSLILVGAPTYKALEKLLQTHDLAVPLPKAHEQYQQGFFLLLLFSTTDVQSPASAMARIERLYHQEGGQHVGIIFLLQGEGSNINGTVSFMSLQASLINTFDMPVIPLYSVDSLHATLFAFQRRLIQSRSTRPPQVNVMTALLPYSSNRPPIPEHARNVLSDICHSIPEIAQAATTPDGREGLRRYLSDPNPAVAEDIIHYWKEEIIFD